MKTKPLAQAHGSYAAREQRAPNGETCALLGYSALQIDIIYSAPSVQCTGGISVSGLSNFDNRTPK